MRPAPQVGYDRFLVELAPGRSVARKLGLATEPERVARLVRDD